MPRPGREWGPAASEGSLWPGRLRRVAIGWGWALAGVQRRFSGRPGPAVVRWGQLMGIWSGLKLPSVPPLRNIGAPSRCVCKRANESPHVWSLRPRNGGDGAWACGGSRAATPLRLTSTPALPPGVRERAWAGWAGQRMGRRRPPSCGGVGTGSRPCPRGRRALNRHLPEELRGDEWGGGWRSGDAGGHRDQSLGLCALTSPLPTFLSTCAPGPARVTTRESPAVGAFLVLA